MSRKTGRKVRGFTPAALKKMEQYEWPSDVRELRNVVEQAVALGAGPVPDAADIWLASLDALATTAHGPAQPAYQPLALEDVEKEHILRTLEKNKGNKPQTAQELGISLKTLYNKLNSLEEERRAAG